MIDRLQLPFSVPGDYKNIISDIPAILSQPAAVNYLYLNFESYSEKGSMNTVAKLPDDSMHSLSTNNQTPTGQQSQMQE